ncbi:MAG: cytochrome c peroxidase [Bacteroidota bacterium]|nr:cytochrome c peroxidase [Bacteroidota bacterium]MDP3145491.1 cytochrome c peroxidase [Bacteroidota bacterium]
MNKFAIIIFLFGFLIFASCKVDPKIIEPLPSDNLVEVVPLGWPQPIYSFSVNTISEDKFVLGRALFYDPILSEDSTISCGSCHQQFVAFAHADHNVSHGIYDRVGTRNSPGLFNLTWHPLFMHDGGVNHIEVQPLAPISNTLEMGANINPVIVKLQASSKYRNMFLKAFGTEVVSSQNMFRAMTQFMGLMYSYNSKFDLYKRRENNVELSDAELRGYNLFLTNCNTCHKEPLFSDFDFRSNGLAVNPLVNDIGREHITNSPQDKYKFKTPSLRNIAKTAPYMHDGRFNTLQQCLDHYANVKPNLINLDPLLLNNGLPLSSQDKQDIIAFLNTLTDYKFLADKRFADPNY